MIKIVCYILSVLLLFLNTSCAPRHVEIPSLADRDLNSFLASMTNILSIEAILSMEYEKNENQIQADASLSISEDHIDLKVYYLGFLAGQFKENNGVVTTSHKIDKNKSAVLIEGLRNSFFWWNIKDYDIIDEGEYYKLKNYNRKILVDKKTLLPFEQTIELYNGDELKIIYDSPAKVDEIDSSNSVLSFVGLWYQSGMRISLNNHFVKIKIKSYTIRT